MCTEIRGPVEDVVEVEEGRLGTMCTEIRGPVEDVVEVVEG